MLLKPGGADPSPLAGLVNESSWRGTQTATDQRPLPARPAGEPVFLAMPFQSLTKLVHRPDKPAGVCEPLSDFAASFVRLVHLPDKLAGVRNFIPLNTSRFADFFCIGKTHERCGTHFAAGRGGPQPQIDRRQHPAPQTRRALRTQRQRQEQPGPGHALRRRAAALYRELFGLHAAIPRPPGEAGSRADRRHSARHRRDRGRRQPIEPMRPSAPRPKWPTICGCCLPRSARWSAAAAAARSSATRRKASPRCWPVCPPARGT